MTIPRDAVRKTSNGRESIPSRELPSSLIDPWSFEATWRAVCDAAREAGWSSGALEAPHGYPGDYDPNALYVTGVGALRDRVNSARRRQERSSARRGSSLPAQSREAVLLSNACMLVSRRMEFCSELRQLRLPAGVSAELARRIVDIAVNGSSRVTEETAARLESLPRTVAPIDDEEIRRAARPLREEDAELQARLSELATDEAIVASLAKHWSHWLALQEEHGGLGTTLAEMEAHRQLQELEAQRSILRGRR